MLKKSALLLFGLAALLVTINPARANAEVVIALGSRYPRPVYVRPYRYVAPAPYVAYRPYPSAYAPAYVYPYNSWRRHRYHELLEHRRHEWREQERREHEGYLRYRR